MDIVSTIVDAFVDFIVGLANGIVNGFETLMLDEAGTALSSFGIYSLTFIGLGFAFMVLNRILQLRKG